MREGAEAFADMRELLERGGPLPCVVGWHGSLEECGRDATMEVYGLSFCEIHGAECKAGALEEFYFDAGEFLGRLDNKAVRNPNAAALLMLREAVSELTERTIAAEEVADDALARAYPASGEEPDPDYFAGYDHLRDVRVLLHRMMRLAFEAEETWLVELLEPERENVAAQLAYLIRSGR